MKLNFNLDNIEYLKLDYINNGQPETVKLALKEKNENDFVGIVPATKNTNIVTPQNVSLSFICHDGLYKTSTVLKEIIQDESFTSYIINNPDSLDYQQNREYYRILAEYDCIYTIETENGIESFNAVTYDISAGGISIITSKNIIPTRETSVVIFMPDRDLKTHLKFVRCETHGEEEYKLSFVFTDLSEKDFEMLSKLCVNKQISSL